MNHPWLPPSQITRDEIVDRSASMLGSPAIPIVENEDVFRIESVGMDWDIGVMVYEPEDSDRIPVHNGSPIGLFLLHGGSNDFRATEGFARLIASRLGYKVVSMTYPGRLYLGAADRRWPGETIREDGSVRTPIWVEGEFIDRDQYELHEDLSLRSRYGVRVVARARPGTVFYNRLAGWPAAFEDGMKQACLRHLGGEFSVFVHGHSTGGPFVSMLSQRVENIRGVLAVENSPFGYIQEQARLFTGNMERRDQGLPDKTLEESRREDRFDDLSIRTWREEARYLGPEVAMKEGGQGLMRLPQLIEEVFESWAKVKTQANFKCEYPVTRNVRSSLELAARVTAERLSLSEVDTEQLVARYLGMTAELRGSEVKPVPPTLFGITESSRDHPVEVYKEVILPMYGAMSPAPRVALTQFGAGVHDYTKREPDLPMGVAPAVVSQWDEAIAEGFFDV